MTPRDVLLAAADLLEPEGRWCQETGARDAAGNAVCTYDPGAVCWCMAGAISMAGDSYDSRHGAYDLVEKWLPFEYRSAPAWNDAPWRTQAEVVAALRAAAALATP